MDDQVSTHEIEESTHRDRRIDTCSLRVDTSKQWPQTTHEVSIHEVRYLHIMAKFLNAEMSALNEPQLPPTDKLTSET